MFLSFILHCPYHHEVSWYVLHVLQNDEPQVYGTGVSMNKVDKTILER